VFPGGTPIMDVLGRWPFYELIPLIRAADAKGKPIYFVGTGTEKLAREESRRLFADFIAPGVRHWSVRCARDKERLTDYGVAEERVSVSADMAWLLDAVPLDFGLQLLRPFGVSTDDLLIGVNINSESMMLSEQPRLFEIMGRMLDSIIERENTRILFLCNEIREGESFDKAANKKVISLMTHGDRSILLPNQYWSPQQMLSVVGCCNATISTRYHFNLFSALQGVPFLALKRSDKVADLCWDLGWPHGVALNEMDSSTLAEMLLDIMNRRSDLASKLSITTMQMRDRAMRNGTALDSYANEARL
jgi:polysaccharide pyruvyl transferase WcaK-like protein